MKYRKEDRHMCSVADEFHNKFDYNQEDLNFDYVLLYAPHFSLQLLLQRNQRWKKGRNTLKKTSTRTVWPTNSTTSSTTFYFMRRISFCNYFYKVTNRATMDDGSERTVWPTNFTASQLQPRRLYETRFPLSVLHAFFIKPKRSILETGRLTLSLQPCLFCALRPT